MYVNFSWCRIGPAGATPVPLFFGLFVILFLFNFTLAFNMNLPETNLNRIFKLLTVYLYDMHISVLATDITTAS